MKKILLPLLLTAIMMGCGKDLFDPLHPDVEKFVSQLKNGTYSTYETGDNGEILWLLMPEFTADHIQSLIDLADDTTHINHFPVNPISSRTPFPNGRDYFILGECLLWTVEGIRNGTGYGSLDPYLVDTALPEYHQGVKGSEILIIRELYDNWWSAFRKSEWRDHNPLLDSSYHWF